VIGDGGHAHAIDLCVTVAATAAASAMMATKTFVT
jgi:hypothetical protein